MAKVKFKICGINADGKPGVFDCETEPELREMAVKQYIKTKIKPTIFERITHSSSGYKTSRKWKVSNIEIDYESEAKAAERQRTADDVRAHENDPPGDKDDDAPRSTNAG